jgi:amylosucrase
MTELPNYLAVADVLGDLTLEQRDMFELRVERWWPDLHEGLAAVYPPSEVEELEARLLYLAATAFRDRDPELARLDLKRLLDPGWFQSEKMIGYACYADRFADNLDGVTQQIGYLKELGVTYLHLMPILKPREGDSDGGYAVADYRQVRADLGNVEDLRRLATALRAEGISLVADLVLNHVAKEHEWAQAARAGDEKYRNYFYIFPDRYMPDAYERTLPEVFPDFAPGNFTWDDDVDGWVWTTFNSFQWDVNWSNPEIFFEYADIILFLASLGVEVLRLDAIAFVWKALGTNCQNQPQVHSLTQALRALTRIAAPAVIFKAEAIVAPQDLVHYLGMGNHHGKVSDLAYHNTLMVQAWSMLAAKDVRLAAHALQRLPAVPATTGWITYLRCHDDIGWAIDDNDAAAVGLNGYQHRAFCSDYFTGQYPGSTARGLVFQYNPATGDRRVSGSAAALVGLDAAVEAGDRIATQQAIDRLLLLYALVLGWGGIPVIWMGDEIGLPNDQMWAHEPGHSDDNRWVHRPRMPWGRAEARRYPGTVSARMFSGLTHLINVRKRSPYLDAWVQAEVLDPSDPGVLPVLRRHPLGSFLGLYNMTPDWRPWPSWRLGGLGLWDSVDILSGRALNVADDGNVWLAPHASVWLVPREH